MENLKIIEIKEELKKLDDEMKKYIFFKIFMENPDDIEYLRKEFSNSIDGINKTYFFARLIHILKDSDIKKQQEIQKVTKTEKKYKNILQKAKMLADELKLTNSLEIANLYTYLLWNGYFSKDKLLKFQTEKRQLIPGAYSNDIMNGIGVCLNFSDMLTDFMNEFEYSSATVINYLNKKDFDVKYKVDIERNSSNKTLGDIFLSSVLGPVAKKFGNHAFNLINENGKLYIYDSTNLVAFKIEDKYKAILIPGKGTIKLNPYFSYYINLSEKATSTLDLMHESKSLESPYSKKDFIIIWEECLELFSKNKNLLDSFYEDIKDEILEISNTNEMNKLLIKNIKRKR